MLVDDAAVLATVSINVEETALQVVREAGRRGGGRGKRKKTIRIRKGSGSATVETQRKVWWQDRRGKWREGGNGKRERERGDRKRERERERK